MYVFWVKTSSWIIVIQFTAHLKCLSAAESSINVIGLFFGSADQTKLQCSSPAPHQHNLCVKIKTLSLFLIERY